MKFRYIIVQRHINSNKYVHGGIGTYAVVEEEESQANACLFVERSDAEDALDQIAHKHAKNMEIVRIDLIPEEQCAE